MLRPQLFVVDEPLANLDPATAARLLGTLRELADEGQAVIIVEHRVEEALELRPDRVLMLDEGIVTYLGDLDGFLRVGDPTIVKLPFAAVLEQAREHPDRAIDEGSPGRRAGTGRRRIRGRAASPRVSRRRRRLRRSHRSSTASPRRSAAPRP
jgi:ABC-type multidrug transport system ATPase subunit